MKISLCLIVTFMFSVITSALGETVHLTSGEVIKGSIVSQTDDSITLQISNAAKTIFEEKQIYRTAIAKIEVDSAQDKLREAYETTTRHQLSSSSFQINYYDKIIKEVFERFLADYPDSPHSASVAKAMAEWRTERAKVETGAIKWGGKWYRGDEIHLVSGMVRATQVVAEGDRLVARGQYERALAKYREALNSGSLPPEALKQIPDKVNRVAQKWHNTLTSRNHTTSSSQTYRESNSSLASTRKNLEAKINKMVATQNLIRSARLEVVERGLKHWVVREGTRIVRDFGAILPDARKYDADIRRNREEIGKIDAKIAANNANIAELQTKPSSQTEVERANDIVRQVNADLGEAMRRPPLNPGPTVASMSGARSTPSSDVQLVRPSMVSTPDAASPTEQPISKASVAPVVGAPQPSSWLRSKWTWIAIAAMAILYFFRRSTA